jgi:hypothetical protein
MYRHLPLFLAMVVIMCSSPTPDAFSSEATSERPANGVSSTEITAERSANGVVVKIDGKLFTEYLVKSGSKPILWPIIGPTGKPMTRDYPLRERAGEAKDHPHQRSLWFTHGDVNGVNFWMQPDQGKAGTTQHVKFVKVASGKPAVIVTQNVWLAPDGKKICEDERTLRFDTDGDARWIDFDITVKAMDRPVTFGDDKEGTFGMRVAHSMSVDAKQGGKIVNSKQQTDAAAWGKPAAWVDYHGPVDGQTVGIAIFNHPTSFRFPTYWHVRTYGLFAANPFGLHEFARGKATEGAYSIRPGQSMTLRYRVFLHRGNEKDGKVADAFAVYAKVVK